MNAFKDLFDTHFEYTDNDNDYIDLQDLRTKFIEFNKSEINYKLFLKYLHSIGIIKHINRVYKIKLKNQPNNFNQPNIIILNVNNINTNNINEFTSYKIEQMINNAINNVNSNSGAKQDKVRITNISTIINECNKINESLLKIMAELNKDNSNDLQYNINSICDHIESIKAYADSKIKIAKDCL